jgi:hypothetical protein
MSRGVLSGERRMKWCEEAVAKEAVSLVHSASGIKEQEQL